MNSDTQTNDSTPEGQINLEAALQLFGNDRDILKSVVEAFLQESPQLMQGIDRALAANDQVQLTRAAHTLKSNFNNLCLSDVSRSCEEIEELSRAGKIDEIDKRADALRARTAEIVAQLQDFLAS